MDWTRPRIETLLRAHEPKELFALPVQKHAAVAAVLRFQSEGPEVLLMERARREGDRWSGQVSFPGGRAEPEDPDLLATAIRETREEVGLPLDTHATLLGRLDTTQAIARGRLLPMTITPFVFVLEQEAPLTLSEEAVATFWLPLRTAAAGELDATYEWRQGPLALPLPAWRYGERTVWGLTYQMLMGLVTLLKSQ